MKNKQIGSGHRVQTVILAMLCLVFLTSSVNIAIGQKKPGSLRQGTTSDDKLLCDRGNNDDSEFCVLYEEYDSNKDGDIEKAKKARNRMIDLVQWQIEIYYKERKDNRKTLVARLQMIFDILEIGTAAATGIIKGTLRAKTVLAQALSGFQAGRTAANKNFDILQTQVLINAMNRNRAEIALRIETSKRQDVNAYTWYKAKEDLTKLLNAGTFSEALDSLVKKTGEDAAKAEAELDLAKKNAGIILAPSPIQIKTSRENADFVEAIIDGHEDAVAKITDADIKIAAADVIINNPASGAGAIAQANTDKGTAQAAKVAAEAVKTKALNDFKAIFRSIEADAKLKPLIDSLPARYPNIAAIPGRIARMRAGTGSFADYGFTIRQFLREVVRTIPEDPTIAERTKSILDSVK